MACFENWSARRIRYALGSLVCAVILSLPDRPSLGMTLKVAVEDADNRPLEYVDDAGQLTGFHIELVRHVAALLGWQVGFDRLPWSRAQALLETGAVDAVTYLARAPAREAYALFLPGNVLSRSGIDLWILKARGGEIHWAPPLLQMMARWRVGVVQGWYYTEDYKDAEASGLPIDRTATNTTALARMLLADRIDIALAEAGFLEQVRKELPDAAGKVEPLPGAALRGAPVYIAFTRQDGGAEKAQQFAEAYARWRATPAYAGLVAQFGVEERVDAKPKRE